MKKRSGILCILVAALVLIAMLPIGASAAADYSRVFANLKFTDVAEYDKPLPPGEGTAKSPAQIKKELAKIGFRIPGNGPVIEKRTLCFSKNDGQLEDASKELRYMKTSGSNTYAYYESTLLENPDNNILCAFIKATPKTESWYIWAKGAKMGEYGSSPAQRTPGKPDRMTDCRKYQNEKVLGHTCFVYSYVPKGEDCTVYKYVSRKTGQAIKIAYVYPDGYTAFQITFVEKYTTKSNKFFKKPKGVKFIKSYVEDDVDG